MLLVALEMLLEMPEMKLFCSAGLACAADFVSAGLAALVFLSFFLDKELPFFI
ncbi:MAG: hypothetical protein LUO89_02740 [Methanothrix sp.]|nr:hypothetical protein [Methanothrix sp.]